MRRKSFRAAVSKVLALTAAAGTAATVHAADYPAKPVRVIIPSAPGGGTDVVARVLAPRLTELWGYPLIIENLSGGATSIGTHAVAKAPADGYTLLMTGVNFAFVPAIHPKLPYDAAADFTPLIRISEQASLILVHPSMPARSLKELIALAKSRPGEIRYSSGGAGTVIHFSTELLRLAAGIDLVHIPYRGAGPATTAVLGGETHMLVTTAAASLPHVQAGRLRALAWTGAQRSGALPALPTAREAGLPGYVFDNWYGLWGPARLPAPVARALNEAFDRALASPAVRERFAAASVEARGGSAETFAADVAAELVRWQKVARAAGIKAE